MSLPLILETRTMPDGRVVLHFPFISISDIHWGTRYSRAKRLAHFLEHSHSDRLMLVGDIIDGEEMMKKPVWNFAPWHRQGIAHILRKAANGTVVTKITGNHDEALRGRMIVHGGREKAHRRLSGKAVYGVDIRDEAVYTDPNGQAVHIIHGDVYDDMMYPDPVAKQQWYRRGDAVLNALYRVDLWVRRLPGLDHFSLAGRVKAVANIVMNFMWGVDRLIAGDLDASPHHRRLYGHSHLGGFKKTRGGKMVMNDGCCVDHVQAMVHDRAGNWALIEWHRDHLDIRMEEGARYTVKLDDLGLDAVRHAKPSLIEDVHSLRADRLLRVAYRLWPGRERQAQLREIRDMKAQSRLNAAFTAAERAILLEKQDSYLKIPIQRHCQTILSCKPGCG